MSLILETGTQPARRLEVATSGSSPMVNTVYFGNYKISIEDFLLAAEYVLTNTDLEPNDPRLQFVKSVQSMEQTNGYNPGRKRLEAS